MKTYTDEEIERIYKAGFDAGTRSGSKKQWMKDREMFQQETDVLRAQLEALTKHVINLEVLKPRTFILKEAK